MDNIPGDIIRIILLYYINNLHKIKNIQEIVKLRYVSRGIRKIINTIIPRSIGKFQRPPGIRDLFICYYCDKTKYVSPLGSHLGNCSICKKNVCYDHVHIIYVNFLGFYPYCDNCFGYV